MDACEECYKRGNTLGCCSEVLLVLNPSEIHLFQQYKGFIQLPNGGLFVSNVGCPYFVYARCIIHNSKPLHCKAYPIYIFGKVELDTRCQLHHLPEYQLTLETRAKIDEIRQKYPIYQQEWTDKEVEEIINKDARED